MDNIGRYEGRDYTDDWGTRYPIAKKRKRPVGHPILDVPKFRSQNGRHDDDDDWAIGVFSECSLLGLKRSILGIIN